MISYMSCKQDKKTGKYLNHKKVYEIHDETEDMKRFEEFVKIHDAWNQMVNDTSTEGLRARYKFEDMKIKEYCKRNNVVDHDPTDPACDRTLYDVVHGYFTRPFHIKEWDELPRDLKDRHIGRWGWGWLGYGDEDDDGDKWEEDNGDKWVG